jgi:GT2 family glycosyltransferase
MNPRSRVSVVLPTVGGSPMLADCLRAIGSVRGGPPCVVLVVDGSADDGALPGQGYDQLITAPVRAGFAVACNLGLAATDTPYVAIVNDDAVLETDWLPRLQAVLDDDPGVAAVQGLNLQLDDTSRVDGRGIGWNRRWQPVQIDHDARVPSETSPVEVFGASATAVLYRSEALRQVAIATDTVFDPVLHTYYDDVDLATRLRSVGHRSLSVPAARALHAGGASTAAALAWRYRQLHGNRVLILARLLGSSFWPRLPAILRPDLGDLARAIQRGDRARWRGILGGWRRGASLLPRFAHRGPPLVPLDEIRRFRIAPAEESTRP